MPPNRSSGTDHWDFGRDVSLGMVLGLWQWYFLVVAVGVDCVQQRSGYIENLLPCD